MSPVTLTFTLTSVAQAAAFAAHAATFFDKEAPPAATPGKPAGKPATKDKPAETPSTASPAPAASATPPAASPAPAPAEPAAKPVKYEETGIGELIQQLVQKDRPAAIALLGKFGAKKGSELKPEQYDAFKTEITAALNPAPADDLA